MKRCYAFAALLVVSLLLSGSNVSFAKNKVLQPSLDVDGTVWMDSTTQEKKAFLIGAGSMVALEYNLRTKHSEQPSKFVAGWVKALQRTSIPELSKKIDMYYTTHPDKIQRNIFSVLWHEIIKPLMKTRG